MRIKIILTYDPSKFERYKDIHTKLSEITPNKNLFIPKQRRPQTHLRAKTQLLHAQIQT